MGSRRGPRKRPWAEEHPELDVERALGGRRTESAADGQWTVRTVSAAAATKTYTCPGCRQDVVPGTAHVVAWSTDSLLGPQAALEGRRHWHTSCWTHRGRRR